MGSLGKSFALILILITAISSPSLLMVKPVGAQSITTPSVAEFSVAYVKSSFYVPPTYEIDQYTGKNVTVQAGHYADNSTVAFTIKNQPFVSFKDATGNYTSLYYSIRFKGHYGNDWLYYPNDPNVNGMAEYIVASSSDYTITALPSWELSNVPSGGQLDFQVQTLIGYDYSENGYAGGYKTVFYYFNGAASDWSNTQTITIPETVSSSTSPTQQSSPTLTATLTPTPTVPEFPTLIILPLLALAMLLMIVFIEKRKTKKG
jgi:hypothetical protein